jgi:hypothetical protein
MLVADQGVEEVSVMTVPPQTRPRQATSERLQAAARHALAEGVEVHQVYATGVWVATSGTQPNVAYVLEIVQGIVRSCSCLAGAYGDPCCKHAARYYVDMGVIELDDQDPPAPAPALPLPQEPIARLAA